MEKRKKIFNVLSLIFNLAIVISTIYAVVTFYTGTGMGNMKVQGSECFVFFTVDSNILMAVISAIMLVFNFKQIKDIKAVVPQWMHILKFIGTTAVTLTFLTVVAFLGPTMGYDIMFEGSCLYMHLTTPLLAIIAFCIFEAQGKLSAKQALFGVIPTIVYGAVYFTMVILVGAENGGWKDFYGFNSGILEGRWYISIIAMPVATYLICLALKAFHNAVSKSNNAK